MRNYILAGAFVFVLAGAAYAGLLYLELPPEYPADICLSLESPLKNHLAN
jgi:hypothetical protein